MASLKSIYNKFFNRTWFCYLAGLYCFIQVVTSTPFSIEYWSWVGASTGFFYGPWRLKRKAKRKAELEAKRVADLKAELKLHAELKAQVEAELKAERGE